MTTKELRKALAEANYPKTFEVNLETLEAAEKEIENWLIADNRAPILQAGPNMGTMFKGVELILKQS